MSEHTSSDCIFCKIVNKEIPATLEYEDDHVVAFKDINPQAPVHFLVIPKVHIPNIGAITDSQGEILTGLYKAANQLARQLGIFDEGYRLVINSGDNGGQTVYHLHLHVLGGRVMRWPPG